MTSLTRKLAKFVRGSVSPATLMNGKITPEQFSAWGKFVSKELKMIENSIAFGLFTGKRKRRDEQARQLINQLTLISNEVYAYLTRYRPVWQGHASAQQIRNEYQFTCNSIEDVLTILCKVPELKALAKVTAYSLGSVKMGLKEKCLSLSSHLKINIPDQKLSALIPDAVMELISKKNISWAEVGYLHQLMDSLLAFQGLTNEDWTNKLISLDFNVPSFFFYCINGFRQTILDKDDLNDQLVATLQEKHRLFNLSLKKNIRMPGNPTHLLFELKVFLTESYEYNRKLIKVRRSAVKDTDRAKTGIRFPINLSVPQFGLFIRMQVEKGILPKENITQLFTFFATHFYTPNTAFISNESLQKKSTDVEFSTAQKLKGQVIGMLNWLNTNFNLSNYS